MYVIAIVNIRSYVAKVGEHMILLPKNIRRSSALADLRYILRLYEPVDLLL